MAAQSPPGPRHARAARLPRVDALASAAVGVRIVADDIAVGVAVGGCCCGLVVSAVGLAVAAGRSEIADVRRRHEVGTGRIGDSHCCAVVER